MVAIQKRREEETSETYSETEYRCPECDGQLTRKYRSWECLDCTHVPYHPAD